MCAAIGVISLVAAGCADDADEGSVATPDTPAADTGTSDAGASDTGASDTGASDTGVSTTSTSGPEPSSGGSPIATEAAPPTTTGVQPANFSTVTVAITGADGEVCEKCMWLADTSGERGLGLMGVTDLGEPSGMVFVFDREATGSFFMLNTPTPLSIAWFSTDGEFVSATDMEPCPSETERCPTYGAAGPYQTAIEVVQGGLADIGIGPGSTVEVRFDTESETCVLAPVVDGA